MATAVKHKQRSRVTHNKLGNEFLNFKRVTVTRSENVKKRKSIAEYFKGLFRRQGDK